MTILTSIDRIINLICCTLFTSTDLCLILYVTLGQRNTQIKDKEFEMSL